MRSRNRIIYTTITSSFIILFLTAVPSWAAVGCDLNDPEKDVKRLFPGSTGYKTVSLDIQRVGGNALLAKIEAKLRDKLHGLYESVDTPYTVYVVYRNGKKIGYIHGVNQKGHYGGIQIFLALDLDQRIKTFSIQKMSGSYAGELRAAGFGKQFAGLTLGDFEQYDVMTGKWAGKVPELKNPLSGPEPEYDFRRILRGTKKNLILINEFIAMSPELAANK